MRKNSLIITIVILSVFFTSTAFPAELIQNGGFEGGSLTPWQSDNGTVSNSVSFEGDYSGVVSMGRDFAQNVAETPGSDITLFSVAVMTRINAWVSVKVSYLEPNPNSGLYDMISERYVLAGSWQTLDFTEDIDSTRTVCGVSLIGHSMGDEGSMVYTYFDAATLQDSSMEEPPEEPPVDKVVPASVRRLKVRFNEKRGATLLRVVLRADELVEAIHEGLVDFRVLISQDGITSEFAANDELINFPHRRKYITRLIGGMGFYAKPSAESSEDGVVQAAARFVKARFNEKNKATVLRLVLKADELVEGIHEGPVDIQVRVSQEGLTTEFAAGTELVDIPHGRGHITRLLDADTAARIWGR